MTSGDTQEKVAEMVQRLQEYDPTSETLTLEEGRELVRRSRMLLFIGWEINSLFLLDQIRKQEKSISFEDVNMFGETRGAGFNIDAKTMAIWSVAPPHEKPSLMAIKETHRIMRYFGMFILQQVTRFTLCCSHLHY